MINNLTICTNLFREVWLTQLLMHKTALALTHTRTHTSHTHNRPFTDWVSGFTVSPNLHRTLSFPGTYCRPVLPTQPTEFLALLWALIYIVHCRSQELVVDPYYPHSRLSLWLYCEPIVRYCSPGRVAVPHYPHSRLTIMVNYFLLKVVWEEDIFPVKTCLMSYRNYCSESSTERSGRKAVRVNLPFTRSSPSNISFQTASSLGVAGDTFEEASIPQTSLTLPKHF